MKIRWWYGVLKVKVTQLCLTLCDPMDHTVPGILQVRILEWVSIPFSRGSSWSRDWTQVSCIAGEFFTGLATRKALNNCIQLCNGDGQGSLACCSPWGHKESDMTELLSLHRTLINQIFHRCCPCAHSLALVSLSPRSSVSRLLTSHLPRLWCSYKWNYTLPSLL